MGGAGGRLRPAVKVGLVAGGYVAAVLIASAVVAVQMALTAGDPDQQGGMAAFGDSLLFLAVFGVAAVPATSALLFFLRPRRAFWRVLSVAAIVVGVSGLAALITYVAAQAAGPESALHPWAALAVLRILAAPLCALGLLLAGLFAPARSSRISLLAVTAVEMAIFAYLALVWILPARAH